MCSILFQHRIYIKLLCSLLEFSEKAYLSSSIDQRFSQTMMGGNKEVSAGDEPLKSSAFVFVKQTLCVYNLLRKAIWHNRNTR